MPRVKLFPKENYSFTTEILVRITDLNYGGHLGNDALLSLIHEARVEFLASYGYSEMDCGGVSLIMGDTAIVYKAEAYAGDVLQFEIIADEVTRSGFRIFYRVTRKKDGIVIALVENGMVCYDYQKKEIRTVPDAVKKNLKPQIHKD